VPNTSTISRHPQREEIEKALVNGETLTNISERYSVSRTALHRRKHTELKERVARAAQERDKRSEAVVAEHVAKEARRATDLLAECDQLLRIAWSLLARASNERQYGPAVQAVDKITKLLTFLAHLQGDLQTAQTNVTQVNLYGDPNWPAVRALVFEVLSPYPEAVERFREGPGTRPD
jgi:hypothetical protein